MRPCSFRHIFILSHSETLNYTRLVFDMIITYETIKITLAALDLVIPSGTIRDPLPIFDLDILSETTQEIANISI